MPVAYSVAVDLPEYVDYVVFAASHYGGGFF